MRDVFRFDGADSDFIYFTTFSRSRVGVEHTVVICKRTGILSCTCEDCSFRKKKFSILYREFDSLRCWHCLRILKYADFLADYFGCDRLAA